MAKKHYFYLPVNTCICRPFFWEVEEEARGLVFHTWVWNGHATTLLFETDLRFRYRPGRGKGCYLVGVVGFVPDLIVSTLMEGSWRVLSGHYLK